MDRATGTLAGGFDAAEPNLGDAAAAGRGRRAGACGASARGGRRARRGAAGDRVGHVPDDRADHPGARRRRTTPADGNPVVSAHRNPPDPARARGRPVRACRGLGSTRPGGGQHVLRGPRPREGPRAGCCDAGLDRQATGGERTAALISVAERARDRLDGVFLVPRVLGTLNWGTAESVGVVVGLERSPRAETYV